DVDLVSVAFAQQRVDRRFGRRQGGRDSARLLDAFLDGGGRDRRVLRLASRARDHAESGAESDVGRLRTSACVESVFQSHVSMKPTSRVNLRSAITDA